MQYFDLVLVGERIREERHRLGIKAKDLAEMPYMDPSTLSRAEKGEGLGQIDKLILVANALGIDVRELIEAGLSSSERAEE